MEECIKDEGNVYINVYIDGQTTIMMHRVVFAIYRCRINHQAPSVQVPEF